MTVTEKLARFVIETPTAAIPVEAREVARRQILDTLGVTLAGSLEPASAIVSKYIRALGGVPEASVLGHNFRTTTENAAFANGVAAHALDFDDTWLPKGHPSCTVFSVMLALGEKLEEWRARGSMVRIRSVPVGAMATRYSRKEAKHGI
ncbi:MAG: MmgE/PrpD family protein [Chloroflexota bacterium]